MTTQINPYLIFNGNCREAMTFYKNCLGGELTMQSVKDSPMASEWPKEVQDNILHASLTNENIVLLASEMGGPGPWVQGNSISLSLNCSSNDEINTFFTNLAEGAKFTRPLHVFYGGTIGTLTDKFGITWMFYYDKTKK